MARDEVEYMEEDDELVKMHRDHIKALMKERDKYETGSEMYNTLTNCISVETVQLRDTEDARNSRVQSECTKRGKFISYIQGIGSFVGPILGNTISSLINRKNVKTVVGVENSGELVNSKAMKFVK